MTSASTAPPTKRTRASRLLSIGAVAVLAPAALTVVARLAGFEWGPFAWLVALTPWALVGVIVAAICAGLARSWRLATASALLAVPLLWWQAPLWSSEAPARGEPALTVASVSMTFGRASAADVVALVEEQGVDILAVQELTPEAADALTQAGLDAHLPHAAIYPEPGYVGTGLWSRLPVREHESVGGLTSHLVRATVDTADGPLAVLAPHPAAPGPLAHAAWSADTSALVEVLTQQDGPTLVVGDLNMTRDHRAMRTILERGYADAADQAGAGLTFTFPEGRLPFPVAGIDHALTRGTRLVASNVATVAIPGADHRALVVEYVTR